MPKHDVEWYMNRPIPERLLKDLAEAPFIPEEYLTTVQHGAGGLVSRRRDTLLTKREVQVIALASHGMGNKEIAGILDIEIETVKSHMKKVIYALRAKNRAHAVAIALRQEIIN